MLFLLLVFDAFHINTHTYTHTHTHKHTHTHTKQTKTNNKHPVTTTLTQNNDLGKNPMRTTQIKKYAHNHH